MKKIASLFLVCIMLVAVCVSCNSGEGNPSQQTTDSQTVGGTETNPYGYEYPEDGFDGRKLVVLNTETQWGYFVDLDFEEAPADPVEDAVYKRNRRLEDKFDFELDVQLVKDFDELDDRIAELYRSQDDVYDVAYMPICRQPSLISDGAFTDMAGIESIAWDQPWWDPQIQDSLKINGKMFLATSAFQLSAYDGTWALFFNEDVLVDSNLEMPYQNVKDGTWTLDKFTEYVIAVSNLNGDESYTWNESGNVFYGVAAHEDSVNYFARGAGIVYATCTDEGEFVVESGSERYFDTFEKLAAVLDETTGRTHVGSIHTDYSYIPCFTTQRALFFPCAMDACRGMLRKLDFTYGILPFPKYDEMQTEYYSLIDVYSLYMTIPSQNQDIEEVAEIMDLLSFESYMTVIPVYYDVAVEQKGLRNEESREMLPYINEGRATDMALLYNAAEQLRGETATKIYRGDYGSLASLLESQRKGIQRRLEGMFGKV